MAALKAVPGDTVVRVETDAAHEAHLTKADGTRVTVKLDKSFALVKVEDGLGLGDPRPPRDDDSDAAGTSGTSGA